MRKEEFFTTVKKLLEIREFESLNENGYPHYSSQGKDSLGVYWCTGGVGGGSCWDTGDDDPHYSREGDTEPEFEQLDLILEHFCPAITFLAHKALRKAVLKKGTYCQNDYYGNYTDYATKYFKVEDLYNYMVEKSLIGSPDSILKKVL